MDPVKLRCCWRKKILVEFLEIELKWIGWTKNGNNLSSNKITHALFLRKIRHNDCSESELNKNQFIVIAGILKTEFRADFVSINYHWKRNTSHLSICLRRVVYCEQWIFGKMRVPPSARATGTVKITQAGTSFMTWSSCILRINSKSF